MKRIEDKPLTWYEIEICPEEEITRMNKIVKEYYFKSKMMKNEADEIFETAKKLNFIPKDMQDLITALDLYPTFYTKVQKITTKSINEKVKMIDHLLDL